MLKLQAILTPILLVMLVLALLPWGHQWVEAQPVQWVEVVERRTENSKTYNLGGGRFRMVAGGDNVHWKYDYQNGAELWKEVDLTWEDLPDGTRQITQAPYILTQKDKLLTFIDRKTGATSTLELLSVTPKVPFEIIPFADGFSFQHRVHNLNVPFEAQFRVTGAPRLSTKAFDDVGEFELEVTFENGILTERLSQPKDKHTGETRAAQGVIRVDPTITIQPSDKDTAMPNYGEDPGTWGTNEYFRVDSWNITNSQNHFRSVLSFNISGLPSGAGIDSANMTLWEYNRYSWDAGGEEIHAYKLTRPGWVETEAWWTNYTATDLWTTPGGDYVTVAPAGGVLAFTGVVTNTTATWNITAIAQDAYDNSQNVHVLMKWENEATLDENWGVLFRSREYATTPSERPYLIIDYTFVPAAPTNVAATDGTHNDKVVVTWTASVNATDYQVYRDGVALGWAGNVTTYDDTGADAGTVTPGTASATSGTHTDKVVLSLTGASTSNGTTHTYKVRARNGSWESVDSATDTGYRGIGALTYQWQRSAADSDAGYSNITGATTTSYNDTAAPAPTITAGTATATNATDYGFSQLSIAGETTNMFGRYYQCLVNASGAAQQTSSSNRGYRGVGTLTYQWQRSAADSDAGYSNITGATTDPYNDTSAVETPDGRYYKCYLTATGATPQTTNASRGSAAVDDPVVTTQAATYIGYTSARLNSFVDYATLTPPIEVRFQYHTTNNFTEVGVNTTAWSSSKYTGGSHWATVSSLSSNTTYYFRAQARHDGATYSFGDLNFTTAVGFSAPTNAYAYTEGNRIVLTWTRGAGTEGTLIRYSTTGYPATIASGTLVGTTALGTITHTNLDYGTTYYYTLWGYAGTDYTTNITVMMTTGAGATDAAATTPTTPALWFTSADYTRFSSMPLYAEFNDFADSLSVPYATAWILGALAFCALIALGVLMKSRRPSVAMIVMGGLMIVMVLLNLLPGWMIVFVVLFFLGASKMASGSLGGAR